MPDTVLEPGMLLFEPPGLEATSGRGHIWTVEKVNKASAYIICHVDRTCTKRARLSAAVLPDGWRTVNHAPLVAHLTEKLASARSAEEGRA